MDFFVWKRCNQVILASALISLGGCTGTESLPEVELMPAADVLPGDLPGSGENELCIAVSPMVSPGEAYGNYEGLHSYLESSLGVGVKILHRPSYADTNNLLRFGHCSVAFVCTYPYVLGRRDFGLEALVVPIVGGQEVYYSYIIVPAASPARSLADIRGGVFAFTDPISNTGRLAPRFALARLGEEPETFFSSTIFTHSHDRSIRAVATGLVGGAGVDSLVYEAMLAEAPELGESLRIIERLGPFAMPPVAVTPHLDPQRKQDLRRAFLEMHESPAGRRALQELGVDRFAPADDAAYRSIREMARALGEIP